MPGGDLVFSIVVLVLGLIGVGEMLIRAVERQIACAGAKRLGARVPDEVNQLRDWGAL